MPFDTALTGLNAASTNLEVISNNIANSSTTGFKRSRAEFADVFASSRLGTTRLGTGDGVTVSGIKQDFSQGDATFTDNNLDLAVDGQGLFQIEDNGKPLYTRAGAFGLDREGFIVNSQGQNLVGYGVDTEGKVLPIQEKLRIDYSDIEPQPTSKIELAANLDSLDEVKTPFDVNDPDSFNFTTSTTIYDSLGSAQVATTYFHKDTPNVWSTYLYVDGVEVSQPGGDELVFDSAGALVSVNGAADGTFTSNTFSPASGANPMSIEYDVSAVSQFEGSFGVNQIVQDGFTSGRLDDFEISSNGMIFGRFSNGQSKAMGQVTLANFPNNAGLRQMGNSSWAESYDSGAPAVGEPGSASLGLVQAGSLESSNVDITEELVKMIGAQRNFQANAQVISTGDSLTQTVINIRR